MAQDAGLVLQPGNGQKAWAMCMCCGCACMLLKSLRKMDKPGQVAHSSYYAAITEEDCTACGICEERCPMDAISIDDVAVVDLDRCIGCGVCSGACEFDAVSVQLKKEEDRYLPPKDMVQMQMKMAKERGLI